MKKLICSTVAALLTMVISMAYAAVPAISVTVSDASGKAAYKGTTDSKGAFATPKLKAGNYVVQFNSKNTDIKGKQFALVVSAGNKKVSANTVAGEKFNGGGVAMKVTVGPNLNITGQIAPDTGKKEMVFIPPALGSNMPGKWVEKGSPEYIQAKAQGRLSTQDIQNMQNSGSSPGG